MRQADGLSPTSTRKPVPSKNFVAVFLCWLPARANRRAFCSIQNRAGSQTVLAMALALWDAFSWIRWVLT
jgi:hypothetical protein